MKRASSSSEASSPSLAPGLASDLPECSIRVGRGSCGCSDSLISLPYAPSLDVFSYLSEDAEAAVEPPPAQLEGAVRPCDLVAGVGAGEDRGVSDVLSAGVDSATADEILHERRGRLLGRRGRRLTRVGHPAGHAKPSRLRGGAYDQVPRQAEGGPVERKPCEVPLRRRLGERRDRRHPVLRSEGGRRTHGQDAAARKAVADRSAV